MDAARRRWPGDAAPFYDALAEYYDLIFEDWDASMARQGAALEQLIQAELRPTSPDTVRVLDVACGIGTQALPLALRGFQVTGRDISAGAIARLRREAEARHVVIDSAVADVREVSASVTGPFDVVLAFDNSLPHLLTAADIVTAPVFGRNGMSETSQAGGRRIVSGGRKLTRANAILSQNPKLPIRCLCQQLKFVFCPRRPPSKMLLRRSKPVPRRIPFTL